VQAWGRLLLCQSPSVTSVVRFVYLLYSIDLLDLVVLCTFNTSTPYSTILRVTLLPTFRMPFTCPESDSVTYCMAELLFAIADVDVACPDAGPADTDWNEIPVTYIPFDSSPKVSAAGDGAPPVVMARI